MLGEGHLEPVKPTEKLGLLRTFLGGIILPIYMGILYICVYIHMILVKGENKLILKRRLSYWILLLGDGFNVF